MKALVLASSKTDAQAVGEIAQGLRPRLDYLCVAEALGADVLDTSLSDWLPTWCRTLERTLASDLTQAGAAWRGRGAYGAWLSTSEKVGLPLALRARTGPPHVLIAHNMRTGRKQRLHKLTRVLHRFEAIVCLSEAQAVFVRDELCLPEQRIHHILDNVDDQFFHPIPHATAGEYILAVGCEQRDYATLIAAAGQANLPLTILASSLWASVRNAAPVTPRMPECVTVRRDFVPYGELRDLYAGARFVAVPLRPAHYAAGVNGVLEAMAMGKASVVTRSPGLAEYVQDRETSYVVPPHDALAMAQALSALWGDASARERMGQAARRRVENHMSMDIYARRIASIVQNVIGE